MAIPTFTPLRPPAQGTQDKPTVNLLVAEFGDGYTQRTRNGMNHIRRNLSVTWEALLPDQAETILSFFRERGGDLPFFYTPSNETTPVKWTCQEWDDTRDQGGLRKITATFVQDFSLG